MKRLSFELNDLTYVSEAFAGGVMVQVSTSVSKTVRVGVETRIDPDAGCFNMQSVMLNGPTAVFAIKDYASDQQFRLRAHAKIDAVVSDIVRDSVSTADLASLAERVEDLEDGQEPLILSVNQETGNLEQTGVSSGSFGLDDTGNLTFQEQ